jgi:uncharacterized membrane protein (UPF0127 family)
MNCCRVIAQCRAAALLSLALACSSPRDTSDDSQYAKLVSFDTAPIRLVANRDTTTLAVELAESADQHAMGLMERRTLAPEAGMLFLYPSIQSDSSAFWMFRTRIPLDIAFIDSLGRIQTIQTMAPCPSRLAEGCPNYPAGARYRAALEVNAGYFSRKQIHIGDRLLLQDTTQRRRASRPPT